MPPIKLHVEVAHAEDAAAGLAHHGKRLGQQVVQRLALGNGGYGTRRFYARSWASSESVCGGRLERVDTGDSLGCTA
jgi:hypothetical protein